MFSGSFRVNFLNPSWSDETPFEIVEQRHPPGQADQQTYEGTFGGPIVKDRLWFFIGRPLRVGRRTRSTLQATGVQVLAGRQEQARRDQADRHGAQNHTIQGGYLNNARDDDQHFGRLQT